MNKRFAPPKNWPGMINALYHNLPYTLPVKAKFFGLPKDYRYNHNGNITVAPRDLKVYKKTMVRWRKATGDYAEHYYLTTLIIPKGTKIRWGIRRKARAAQAIVVSHKPLDGAPPTTLTTSGWSSTFEYQVGATVTPVQAFNNNRYEECGSGIHFLLSKQEAKDYAL